MDTALRHIKRLQGMHVEESTGRLVFVGERCEEEGPLRLSDLSMALWGEFLGNYSKRLGNKPGVTIDPAEGKDWDTQPMRVFYGGGTENTRLGLRMFECDWLLKGLGLGVDAIASKSARESIPGFITHLERARQSDDASHDRIWSRFWLALCDESKPQEKQLVPVEISDANDAIWFPADFKLYANTKAAIERPSGKREEVEGLRDKAAQAFVRHFNEHFDDYARAFPILEELREAAKLTVAARWLRDREPRPKAGSAAGRVARFDHALLFIDPEADRVETKTEVPVQRGKSGPVRMAGGVNFQSPGVTPTYNNMHAHALSERVTALRSELRDAAQYVSQPPDGVPQQFAVMHPPATGPPTAQPGKRPKLKAKATPSTGALADTPLAKIGPPTLASDSQKLAAASSDLAKPPFTDLHPPSTGPPSAERPALPQKNSPSTGELRATSAFQARALAPYDLAVDATSGGHPDCPQLHKFVFQNSGSPLAIQSFRIVERPSGRVVAEIDAGAVHDILFIDSPSGRTRIDFDTEMKLDENNTVFCESVPAGFRYYPKENRVVAPDGMAVQFDAASGLPVHVDAPAGNSLDFFWHALEDGAFKIQRTITQQEMARPPPKGDRVRPEEIEDYATRLNPPRAALPFRRSLGKLADTSSAPDLIPWLTIKNTATNDEVVVTREDGEILLRQ